ncbi:MAG TPA: hypothetical protein VN033_09040 [Vulgatibacter sp.]|nr:hypothetical protein [Vulgatibacter sp.]
MFEDFDDDEPTPADRVFREFDCPACNANNPADDGFVSGDEVICSYCGLTFVAGATAEGRLRLREA